MEENNINNPKAMDVVHFHIPRWNELPNLDLYLDQTVTLLEKYLQNYIGNKDEKIITKTMINNYVKAGLMKAPKKKKYNRTHIATLFVICTLKQIYSINDIYELILLAIKTTKINHAYDQFCTAMEKAIALTFAGEQYTDDDNMTSEKYLLKNVVQSFANKLYVEKTFLHK